MNSLKPARFAEFPTAIGFNWRWLVALVALGVAAGLVLALVKSLPVS